jgi:hypothetical protein
LVLPEFFLSVFVVLSVFFLLLPEPPESAIPTPIAMISSSTTTPPPIQIQMGTPALAAGGLGVSVFVAAPATAGVVTIGPGGNFRLLQIDAKSIVLQPGARILGGVNIGDRVMIGANCVVSRDVASDMVVMQAPVRGIPRSLSPHAHGRAYGAGAPVTDLEPQSGIPDTAG